jgi:hypothetical protein
MRPENVSLTCFFASYVLAMGLEATRLLRSSAVNRWAAWVAAAAGFCAQTIYLVMRSRAIDLPPLLASTHDWLLVLAWLTVLIHLLVSLLHREVAVGLFLLPVVLVFVGASRFVSHEPTSDLAALQHAYRWWGLAHAAFLVLGIGGVVIAAGLSLMYLAQHSRLKQGHAQLPGLRMFSLEALARLNWWSIVISVPLLTLGFATGVLLTWLSRRTGQPVSLWHWSFLVSGLSWLALVALFGWLLTSRRPTGRLIAWRTLLAGGFVLVTLISLGIVSGGMHGDALMRSNRLGFAPSESRRSVRQWPADERALDVSSAAP